MDHQPQNLDRQHCLWQLSLWFNSHRWRGHFDRRGQWRLGVHRVGSDQHGWPLEWCRLPQSRQSSGYPKCVFHLEWHGCIQLHVCRGHGRLHGHRQNIDRHDRLGKLGLRCQLGGGHGLHLRCAHRGQRFSCEHCHHQHHGQHQHQRQPQSRQLHRRPNLRGYFVRCRRRQLHLQRRHRQLHRFQSHAWGQHRQRLIRLWRRAGSGHCHPHHRHCFHRCGHRRHCVCHHLGQHQHQWQPQSRHLHQQANTDTERCRCR